MDAEQIGTVWTESPRSTYGRDLYEWVRALVSAVTAVVLIFTFAVRLIGVDGRSMVPTLQNGDRLAVTTGVLAGEYRPGDIVVLRKASFLDEPIVKRVIAVAGQTVDIDFSTGSVRVDGKTLNEPYISELTFRDEGNAFPLTVPEGSVFVMGDNRNHSTDSRDARLGTVDTGYIIGRAVFLLYPGVDQESGARDMTRIGPIR